MDFVMKKVGDENLLIPLGVEVLHLNGIITLNPPATFLWDLLYEERTMEELIIGVMNRFDVTIETANNDVRTFVDEITCLGLLDS